MAFDVKAALEKGYTSDQIADYLGQTTGFDVKSARSKGYDDEQIVSYLSSLNPAPGVKQEAPKPEKSTGLISGFFQSIGSGAATTGRSVAATGAGVVGANQTIEGLAESEKAAQPNQPAELKKIKQDLASEQKRLGPDAGFWDSVRSVGSTLLSNPKGAAFMVAEQLPNAAATLGVGAAGAAALAPLGPIAAGAGFLGGMFLGNTSVEAGGKLIEKAEGGLTDAERVEGLKEGAIKGGVITAVDALTLKTGGALAKSLNGAAINAGARAEAKVLADAGVNVADKAAIETALRSSPELLDAAKKAGQEAAGTAMTVGQRVKAAGAGLTLESLGEGLGEFAGEFAATGKADIYNAVLESFTSLGQSSVETGYNLFKAQGNDLNAANIAAQQSRIRAEQALQGATNAGEAVAAAAALVSPGIDPGNMNSLLTGLESATDAYVGQAKQGLISDVMQSVESQTGLATPEQAQLLQEQGMGSRIDGLQGQEPAPAPINTLNVQNANQTLEQSAQNAQIPVDPMAPNAVEQEVARVGQINTPAAQAFVGMTRRGDVTAEDVMGNINAQNGRTRAGVIPTSNPIQPTAPQVPVQAAPQQLAVPPAPFKPQYSTEVGPAKPATLQSQSQTTVAPVEQQQLATSIDNPPTAPTQSRPRAAGLALTEAVAEADGLVVEGQKLSFVNPAALVPAARQTVGADGKVKQELDRNTYRAISAVARVFGKEIKIVDGKDMDADGFVTPESRPRTIFLNQSSTINPTNVFFHEMLHLLKNDNADAYNVLANTVKSRLSKDGEDTFAQYYNDPNMDSVGLLEELSADLFGKYMSDGQMLRDVFMEVEAQVGVDKAKGIIERFAAAVMKAVDAVLSAIKQGDFASAAKAGFNEQQLLDIKAAVKQAAVDYAVQQRRSLASAQAGIGMAQSKVQLANDVAKPLQNKVLRYSPSRDDADDQPIAPAVATADRSIETHILGAARVARVVSKRVTLTAEEKQAIDAAEGAAKSAGVSKTQLTNMVRTTKAAFPASDGWAPLIFTGVTVETDKKGKKKMNLSWQAVPYTFNSKPGKTGKNKALDPADAEYQTRVSGMAGRMANEVLAVYERSMAGDKAARNIIEQAGWYKEMRGRLRQEFGGLGDLFADLLGATSPNTPVRENWKYAVDVLRKASQGDFDALMPQWQAWSDNLSTVEQMLRGYVDSLLDQGMSKKDIFATSGYEWLEARVKEARKLPDSMLPLRDNGKKYGFNGQNVIKAMLDLWRVVKDADADIGRGGTAPKALNFSGNLIGFRERATIDVWAARMLQRLAGGARIAPPAETSVSGEMRRNGQTTLAFGFGQDVFSAAVQRVRSHPDMSKDATLASVNDDDLQALVWFIEKEVWTKNNWTSAAGEGGSFELEADLTGSSAQERIRELRKTIDSSKSSQEQKSAALAELTKLSRPVDRYTAGLSIEQSADLQGNKKVPTDVDQKQLAQRLATAAYQADTTNAIIASKFASTFGRYGADERALDLELVTREGYDAAGLAAQIFTEAQNNNQDAAFIARGLRASEDVDYLKHRPGVELYFRNSGDLQKLDPVLRQLDANGVQFFTFIVDGRRSEQLRSGAMPDIVGLRMMYLPEFDARYGNDALADMSDAELVQHMEDKARELSKLAGIVLSKVPGVTYAEVLNYEVETRFKNEYQGAINGYSSAKSGAPNSGSNPRPWAGRSNREAVSAAVGRTEASGSSSERDGAGDAGPLDARDSQDGLKKSTQRAVDEIKQYASSLTEDFFRTPAITDMSDAVEIGQRLGLKIRRDDSVDTRPSVKELYVVDLGGGKDAYITVANRDVARGLAENDIYINVAALESGDDGSKVYMAAGALAYNRGYRLVGDPDGITEAAKRRRLENMIALGLKYGTTRFFEPHRDMLGWNGLQWRGSDDQKLAFMLQTSYAVSSRLVPEIKNVVFDQDAGTFRSLDDQSGVSVADFRDMAKRARGSASPTNRAGMPGSGTLRLGVIYKSLASISDSAGPGPLGLGTQSSAGRTSALRDSTKGIRASTQRNPLGFYSALTKGVEGVSANAAPAAGWKDAMKGLVNKGLVKADEVEWSGVNDWLDLQTGKVSKEQVLDYLRNNGVQVKETVLGSMQFALGEMNRATDDELRQMYAEQFFDDGQDLSREELLSYLEPDMEYMVDGGTRFKPYTLPGGENYREVLLTLPEKEPSFIVDDFIARMSEKYGREVLFDIDGQMSVIKRDFPAMLSAEDQAAYYRAVDEGKKADADAGAQFRSSHWDQPNVLAHLRVNDRVDVDGNKVLFVEELQSDWGQKGREQGFQQKPVSASDIETKTLSIEEAKAMDGVYLPMEYLEEGRMKKGISLDAPVVIFRLRGGSAGWGVNWAGMSEQEVAEDAAQNTNEFTEVGVENARRGRGLATAPFVTKTDGWLNLLLKRAITMAVQGGYNKVAFTTGDQNADRYSDTLTDRVDLLTRSKTFQGHAITAYKNDQMIITKVVADEKEAAALVGKEIAQRLFADQDQETLTEVKGEGLRIGGDGMRKFYDQIVPQALNKLIKKFDSKTETVTIEYDPNPELDKWEPEDGVGDGSKAPVELYNQPGFTVTDKMRDVVSREGLPLFSRQRRLFTDVEPVVNEFGQLLAPNGRKSNLTEEQWYQVRSPEFKAWFGDWEKDPANASRVVDANGEPMVVYHGTGKGGFAVFNTPGGRRRGDIAIFATDNRDMADSYVRRGRASRDVKLPAKYTLEDFQARGFVAERSEDGDWGFYDYNSGDQIAQADTLAELIDSDDAQNTLAEMGGGSEYGVYPVFVNLRDALTVDAEDNLWNEVPEYGSTDNVGREAYQSDMDGAIVSNVIDDGGGASAYDESPSTIYMVFDPNNIKSANSNVGSFSRTDSDIRRSRDRSLNKNAAAFRDKDTSADRFKRSPELQQGLQDLIDGKITRDDYDNLVDTYRPVKPYDKLPELTTPEAARYALAYALPKGARRGEDNPDVEKRDKYGKIDEVFSKGDLIQLRLDIPSYESFNTWVNSVHKPTSDNPDVMKDSPFKAGKAMAYESIVVVTDAFFGMNQKPVQAIALSAPKNTVATILGRYQPTSTKQAYARAKLAMKSSNWAQVGMDPFRHSYFYDRNSMQPVVSAEEVIQIGPLVLAKNPVYGDRDNYLFSRQRQTDTPEFKRWSEGLAYRGDLPAGGYGHRGVFKAYHQTDKSFDEFMPGGPADLETRSGKAIWLSTTPDADSAGFRTRNAQNDGFVEGANTMPLYVKMYKPLVIRSEAELDYFREQYGKDSFGWPFTLNDESIKAMKAAGYDAVINRLDLYKDDTPEIAVFDGKQLKSAIGNDGNFDPTNPDIRRSTERQGQSLEASKKELEPLFSRERSFYMVHAGSNFDTPSRAYLGMGEPGNIRPLGRGLYGYLIRSRDEVSRALKFARMYLKYAPTEDKAIHLFKVDIAPGEVAIRSSLWANNLLTNEQMQRAAEWRKVDALPPGEARKKAFDDYRKKYPPLSYREEQAAAASLPYQSAYLPAIELVEFSVQDFSRLQRVNKYSDSVSDSEIEQSIRAIAAQDSGVNFSRQRSLTPAASKMDDVIYKLQDKNIDLKRVTQAILKDKGAIDDEVNAYQREELYHGRAAKQSQDFLNKELMPLLESMRQQKVALKDFETYLWNRHAEERNVQIAKVNDRFPDGGSGIKTADARAYLAKLDPAQRKTFEELAKRVDSMTAMNMQMMVDTGLESMDTIKAMRETYEFYVPLLRGESSSYNGRGQGYSIQGATTKRALGSDKPVENILSALADQREKIISRAEKARVGRSLMGLALENPDENLWFVFDPLLNNPKENPGQADKLRNQLESMGLDPDLAEEIALQPYEEYMGANGKVARRPNRKLMQVPNAVAVRINGEDKFIVLNQEDPRSARMAEALTNLDAPQLEGAISVLGKISRYFASINTQYNPVFGIVNALRDTEGAMLNLSSTKLAGKQVEVTKGVPSAISAIYKTARATRKGEAVTGEWATLYQRFLNQGGQTGYRDMFESPKDRTDRQIRAELDPTAFELAWKKSAGKMFDWLSDYNETMENAVRLSAFKVALESGMTDEQAASLAKNLTVNFNRKGQIGVQAGALYAFYNASTQGTARLVETMKGPAGRKIAIGGVLLGVAQTIMLAMAGFDDEEPPEFVRERNLVIPTGNGKYATLPMPLGPHVLPNIGRILAEQFFNRTDKSFASSMASLFGTVIDAFNPVGSGSLLQTMAPTVLDPAVALAENKDFTGKPIARADFNESKPTPGYTRARDNSMPTLTAVSKTLNWLSGGSDYTKGVVSPTPDQLEYLLGQATGGVGRELSKINQVQETVRTGEELPSYKVPLAGRFFGDTREQSSAGGQFYVNLRSMNDHKLEIEGRAKNGEDVAGYLQENPDARLFKSAEKVEQRVQELRKLKRQLIERDGSPERVRQIDDAITRVMRSFNDQVRASKGRELVN